MLPSLGLLPMFIMKAFDIDYLTYDAGADCKI